MKIKTPHYYENFKCIASACSDSCCAGWEVDLDDEAFERYEKVEGSFGDRLRSEMSEAGERHFIIHDKRCPFLNNENLCDIYTQLGQENLCRTCTNFPRCYEEYGSTMEMALSMACPEVVRLMLESKKHISFNVTDDHKAVSHYNDIHPELYMTLSTARDCIFGILKSKEYNILDKLFLIVSLGDELERFVVKEKCGKMTKVLRAYGDCDSVQLKLAALRKKYCRYSKYTDNIMSYLKIIRNCECISKKWINMLDMLEHELEMPDGKIKDDYRAFFEQAKEWEEEYEYFLENLTYRYFLRGVFDYHIADKTRFLAFMYLFLISLDMAWQKENKTLTIKDRMYIMQTLSKEIEHSDENMALLWDMCTKGKKLFSTDFLLGTIFGIHM